MITNDETDIATSLGPEDGAGALGVPPFQNNETTALRMQATEAPLNDMRVRQAINYAINRTGIVKALFRGLGGDPASQLIPSGVVGYNDQLALWPHDTDKAKALVAEAKADGVPVDTQIRLIGRTAQFPKIAETIEVIQSELAEIGLNVKIEMMDTAGQLQYQLRPFPANTGPYLLMIQHGNQAGDAAFTMDQYMLSDGPPGRLRHQGIRREDSCRGSPHRPGPPRRIREAVRRGTAGDHADGLPRAHEGHPRKVPHASTTPRIRRPVTRCGCQR